MKFLNTTMICAHLNPDSHCLEPSASGSVEELAPTAATFLTDFLDSLSDFLSDFLSVFFLLAFFVVPKSYNTQSLFSQPAALY